MHKRKNKAQEDIGTSRLEMGRGGFFLYRVGEGSPHS